MGGNERYMDIYKDSLYVVSKEQINTCTFQIGYNDTNSVGHTCRQPNEVDEVWIFLNF